jgi:hypothetical protein
MGHVAPIVGAVGGCGGCHGGIVDEAVSARAIDDDAEFIDGSRIGWIPAEVDGGVSLYTLRRNLTGQGPKEERVSKSDEHVGLPDLCDENVEGSQEISNQARKGSF